MPTSQQPKSPDFLFAGEPLRGTLDEEGVLDTSITTKQVRESVRGEVKDVNSKALAEELDSYTPRVYDRFSDKRFRSVTNG